MTEKYLLFAGEFYYPSGGLHDFIGNFKTIEDAKGRIKDYHDWYHIVDLESLEIVDEGSKSDDEIKTLMGN